MTERAPLDVACAVEGDYVPHSAAMLHSVLAHRRERDLRVHYLHGPDFRRDACAPLTEMIEAAQGSIRFIEVEDDVCSGLPTKGFTGKATWYRVFLPDLLPDLDRVLVLDADVIVTDGLEQLWMTDIRDHYLAAVTNVLAPQYMHRPADLGISPHAYFNAGVMLLNLELMRKEGCVEATRSFAVDHAPELTLRDQDALNAVLASRRISLHPRWNYMNAMDVFPWAEYVFKSAELAEARSQPAIRHFEGPAENKPWHSDCSHAMRDEYAHHRAQTPWPQDPTTTAARGSLLGRVHRLRRLISS